MTVERLPVDHDVRQRITVSALDETLFVVAGAGSGKTTQLVARLVRLVIDEGVPLASIAAITFTHAAATELADRVREALERVAADPQDAARVQRARVALAEADAAAITTLHSFAQRLLAEHPVEAGLPPRVEVLDEVRSQLEFERRWDDFLDELLADPTAEQALTWALWLKVPIVARKRQASLKDIAAQFDDEWDRLGRVAALPDPVLALSTEQLRAPLAAVRGLRSRCADQGDQLARHLAEIEPWLTATAQALDDSPDAVVRQVAMVPKLTSKRGQKAAWDDVQAARQLLGELAAACQAVADSASRLVLWWITVRLARLTATRADERRRDGRLEFHDLLVLARGLLRSSPSARSELRQRYARLLIDEFQDTDPIQIELAVLLAATTAPLTGNEPWPDIAVDPERLFFVGDPTQSIYRFRRADINLYLQARDVFGPAVHLSQNFRTVPTIVGWVNHVFGALMPEEVAGRQPEYQPLAPWRQDGDGDHRVCLLGGPGQGLAAELRTAEAESVAAVIGDIRDRPDRWLVWSTETETWRLPELRDVTILLPTRTSLRFLERALEARAIPYRADTGSLVYNTQEVRDLLAVLRAAADPHDGVAIVAALRSPLFACGDDDLVRYHMAGGRFDLQRSVPPSLGSDDPVVAGMGFLRDLAERRQWTGPSELLEHVVRDRRVRALAFGQRRYRDVWRRVRFLVDQARQFADAEAGALRDFLAWADLQRAEAARVHEPVLPEQDDDSVRIMTIHGAKGLEFPITIVSGLTTQWLKRRTGVQLRWDGDEPHVRLGKDVATEHFDRLADIEDEMDAHEKDRLLYVALTRARDHLVVSTYHQPGGGSFGEKVHQHAQAVLGSLCRSFELSTPLASTPVAVAGQPPDPREVERVRTAFVTEQERLLADAARPRTVSPTALARDVVEDVWDDTPDDGTSAAAVPLAPVHRRGRAGTAVGRAVHAVLQSVDLTGGAAIDDLARTHAQVEDIPDLTATVAQLARSALQAPVVQVAARNRHWRELYVATPVGERVLEGYVDLLVEHPARGGLVVVDFKTDAVGTDSAIDAALGRYRPQGAAYALALQRTTGMPVVGCCFVFLRAGGPVERWVDDLPSAVAAVEAALTTGVG